MSKIVEFFRVLWNFFQAAPTLIFFKPPADDTKTSLGLMFQNTAAKYPNKSAIVCGDSELTWSQFNALTNQYAHSLKNQGVARGDCVAVLIENRTELLCSIFALAKIGATAGMVNTGLIERPLAHCISIVESTKCLVGQELLASIAGVKGDLALQDKDYLWVADPLESVAAPDWATDFSATLADMPTDNLPETEDIIASDYAYILYTSGTTGLPKGVVYHHRGAYLMTKPYSTVGFHAKPSDRMYICLPLYHARAFCWAWQLLVLWCLNVCRRRFSATSVLAGGPKVPDHLVCVCR